MQQVNPAQQARRIEVGKIRTAIEEAIPVDILRIYVLKSSCQM